MKPIENNPKLKRSERAEQRRCPRCNAVMLRWGSFNTKTNEVQQDEYACLDCIKVFERFKAGGIWRYRNATRPIPPEEKAKIKARAHGRQEQIERGRPNPVA